MNRSQAAEDPDDFKAILSGMARKKMTGTGQTLLDALEEITAFVQDLAARLETSDISPPVACSKGCSYCCYARIQVIPVEALLIFSFIEKQFHAAEINDLKNTILDNLEEIKGKTGKQKTAIQDRTACIFLRHGQCRIYPVRPFICRSWHSFDLSACKSAFVSGNHKAKIKTLGAREYMFGTAMEAFQDIGERMDVENGVYTLPEAILSCLACSDPLENWLAGLPVFDHETGDPDP